MRYEYTLNENDYLTNSLFTASKSPTIKKRRLWTRLLIPIVYIVLGIWMWSEYRPESTYIFFVLALIWYLISPWITGRRFVKYYKSAIQEAYGKRLGRPCSLEIGEDVLISIEEPNESRMKISDVEIIHELSTHLLIKIKTSNTIILPLDKIQNTDELKREVKAMATKSAIPYYEELEWKWK